MKNFGEKGTSDGIQIFLRVRPSKKDSWVEIDEADNTALNFHSKFRLGVRVGG